MTSRCATALCCLALVRCAALSTEVTIPDKPLPLAFEADAGTSGPSVAQLSWREWFKDAQLEPLVEEALTNNQDLLVAMQRIELARAHVRRTTGALFPQVGLAVRGGVRKFGLYTMDGAGNATTEIRPGQIVPENLPDLYVGLEASWEVDLWGRLRNERRSALAQHLATVEETNGVLSTLVADVAGAYVDLLALDHVREVVRRTVERQTEAVEVMRLQMEAGRANQLAVQQFEAQLKGTRALDRALQQDAVEAENRLNVLLGRFPRSVPRDKARLFADVPAAPAAGLPSELLQYRPDIRRAEFEVQASQFDVLAARAAFFPSLNLSAGLGYQAFNPAFLLSTPQSLVYSVLGGLVTPLVNWTGLQANFSGAKASQLQAMYEYQRTVVQGFTEVVNALSNVRNSEELLALRKARKEDLEQSVETATVLFRAGKASYLEVLVAQQSTLEAELDLIDAWRRRRVANIAVYKALGGGWR